MGTTLKKGISVLCAAGLAGVIGTAIPANASAMKTSGWTTQPIGHYTFCQEVPEECARLARVEPEPLPRAKWRKMVSINTRVNTAVAPRTDMEMWGVNELWSYPDRHGDCEDYVLLKRHMLEQAGFHPANLLITVVRQPNGDGHAVLTVRTAMGDFVLDNMRNEIRDWRDTEYTYLKRQSTKNAGRWVTIEDDRHRLAKRN